MKKLLAIFFAFWSFFYSNVALAQTPSPYAGWSPGITSTGQTQWYGPGSMTKSSATVGQAVWDSAVGGGAKMTATSQLAFGASKAPVVIKGIATGAAIVTTAKAILGGPVGVGMTALMLAPALVDWFTTDTTRPGNSSTWASNKPFEMLKSDGCTSSPCYEYSTQWAPTVWYSTNAQAASAAAASATAASSEYGFVVTSVSDVTVYWAIFKKSDGSFYTNSTNQLYSQLVPPTAPQWVPASIDDIRAKMEVEPYITGVIPGLLDAGGSLPIAYAPGDGWSGATGPATTGVTPPVVKSTVVGPAATSASVSTIGGNPYNLANNTPTVTNTVNGTANQVVDGKSISIPTKLVTTSTYDPATGATTNSTVDATPAHTVSTSTQTKTDLQYGNGTPPGGSTSVPTVTGTTTTTTTTTVANNVTNNVVNNSTTTENNPSKAADPLPVEDPCDKHPERIGCIDIDTPTGEIPKESKTITYTAESMFGSGSCPANLTASIGTLGKTVTVWDWQKTCEYSLPLRALIMALAGFAAFLIVMPVKVDV